MSKIVRGVEQALAVAKGETPAARITIKGHAYVPEDEVAETLRRIAMDIGKQVVDHIEHAYPRMCEAVAWHSARTSIRNATHNAVMAAVEASNKGQIETMLDRHDQHRRTMRKLRKAAGQRY